MDEFTLQIPREWEQVEVDKLHGVLLVVGAPDVGKSTFAQYLYRRLSGLTVRAYVDGDPGQTTLGPPSTMTLALGAQGDSRFPPLGRRWRSFVGAVSPVGHMPAVLVGAARLVRAAREAGAGAIVYDTTGLVDPRRGGGTLKLSKIALLRPSRVFAIQRDGELEEWLAPLRLTRRVHIVDLPASPFVRRRDTAVRQRHRAGRFAEHLLRARPLAVRLDRLAVLPAPHLEPRRLVAFEDRAGLALSLGIVAEADAQRATLLTPLRSLRNVDALHVGDLVVDPETFRDQPAWRAASEA